MAVAGPEAPANTVTLEHPDAQPVLSRLGVTGSLRRELEALLAAAPPDAKPEQYRRLIVEENAAGKSSAAQRLQVWWRLKLRYVLDPEIAEFRAFRRAMDTASSTTERGLLCLLMFARTDRLFREATLECVSPRLSLALGEAVDAEDVGETIRRIAESAGHRWSPTTLHRSRAHLLSTLKDFGVLAGHVRKRTVPRRPTPTVTAFVVRLARLESLTDRQALGCRWFRLLGADEQQATSLLYAAQRAGSLSFQERAGVVEIGLPEEAS